MSSRPRCLPHRQKAKLQSLQAKGISWNHSAVIGKSARPLCQAERWGGRFGFPNTSFEVCGYLDSNNRGDRADECEAIETFFMDSLNKP
jgi:hypothetical protein